MAALSELRDVLASDEPVEGHFRVDEPGRPAPGPEEAVAGGGSVP